MVNKKTKLLKYLHANGIQMIDVFKRIMWHEGNISYQTIWNVAHGYTNPQPYTKKLIATALKEPISNLFDV